MIWDERYDEYADPEERLIRIADLMKQIAGWTPQIREQKMTEARAIAEYNRQHFFSKEFFNLIVDELKTNLTSAFDELKSTNDYTRWISYWNKLLTYPQVVDFLNTNQNNKDPTMPQVDFVMHLAKSKLQ
jgi:hypothetical protein